MITRVPRNIQTEDGAINYNVTFLKLNVEVLYNLTYPSEDQVQNFVGGTTRKGRGYYRILYHKYREYNKEYYREFYQSIQRTGRKND